MNWDDLSEITFGLMLKGKLNPDAVRSDLFTAPYNDAVSYFKKGNSGIEFMIGKIGLTPVQAALDAASNVNGNKIDWTGMLEKASVENLVANKLDRIIKNLRKGEPVNHVEVIEQLNLLSGEQTACSVLTDIQDDAEPFQPTGWENFDKHLIGFGKTGLITIGGPPSSGKTTIAIRFISSFLRAYPDKKVVMFSLEMSAPEFKKRAISVGKLSKSETDRIYIVDEITPVEPIVNRIARLKDEGVGLAVIDFADMMIKDESNESEMAKIYRECATCAKRIGIPIILLSQLSRAYMGGMPRPYHLRYTSMAEALSWQILMLYNPWTDFRSEHDSETLPSVDGKAYLICWKCRGGFRLHDDQPGAISLPWSGKTGWGEGNNSTWFKVKGT